MTRSRRPIVSVAGETRSKGSVSQAGKRSMASSPSARNCRRSWARRSASAVVGTPTTSGRRPVRRASPARKNALGASDTATTRAEPPASLVKAGSSRRSAGSSESDMGGTQDRSGPDLVDPVHGALDALGQDQLHGVGRLFEDDVDLGALGLGEPAQHVVGALAATRRL